MWAVQQNKMDCVRFLLEAGADKDAKDKVCDNESWRRHVCVCVSTGECVGGAAWRR